MIFAWTFHGSHGKARHPTCPLSFPGGHNSKAGRSCTNGHDSPSKPGNITSALFSRSSRYTKFFPSLKKRSHPLLGIYLGKNDVEKIPYPYFHRSTICKSQDMEQPKCPLTDDWIKKMWYIDTVEYEPQP